MKAQAGKGLCVSETIYPGGSRHIVSLVCRGAVTGAVSGRERDVRPAGREFVDLRGPCGAVVAFTAWTADGGKRFV